MTTWIADTSVAVPLLQASHAAHSTVVAGIGDRVVRLAAHAAIETYSVLTRLPGDARLSPADAARLITETFGDAAALDPSSQSTLVTLFSARGIAGGAVYDAVIALTAQQHEAVVLTRDARAAATYTALGASFEIVG
jgi:hypothetical protein